ncbi:MAG: glucoamylase family protein, partial [Candidatus Acidiferrales bacterium]
MARFGAVSPLLGITRDGLASVLRQLPEQAPEPSYKLTLYDETLLNDFEQAACLYFWEQANPDTGLVKDRSTPSEFDDYTVASIAATGFGLTALCIADKRGFIPNNAVISRVRATLKFLATRMYNQHGFFYHFVDVNTGTRAFDCEVSSIDTGLLLCGILMCKQYFADEQIRSLAGEIFDRVDWQWMLDRGRTLSHGWTPENGFLPYRWNTYCELMLMYLLGIGSRTHAIPADTWDAWWR